MRYTVYKTTNTVNGKFYVGAHSTEDPNDDYLGSGSLLQKAIRKYGKGAFTKEVLHDFDTPEEMFAKEREIVTPEFKNDPGNYNLREGGRGVGDIYTPLALRRSTEKCPGRGFWKGGGSGKRILNGLLVAGSSRNK